MITNIYSCLIEKRTGLKKITRQKSRRLLCIPNQHMLIWNWFCKIKTAQYQDIENIRYKSEMPILYSSSFSITSYKTAAKIQLKRLKLHPITWLRKSFASCRFEVEGGFWNANLPFENADLPIDIGYIDLRSAHTYNWFVNILLFQLETQIEN